MSIVAFLLRNWLQIAIGAAVIAAVVWIDQNGYERAERAAQAREQAIQQQVADMEKRLVDRIGEIDTNLTGRIGKIDTTERTVVNPIITKEIASDPRFSNPAQGITPAMRDAINRARAESGKE